MNINLDKFDVIVRLTGSPGNTEITIAGTGFDTTHGNNNVTIGDKSCTTTSATATQIVCEVGDGPRGTFPVMVDIASAGSAENAGNNITFTYNFQISSVSPTTCSIGGIVAEF